MTPSNNQLVSLIFPVKNEGSHVKNTLDSLQRTKTNVNYEVVVVDDASEDGCCDFLADHEYPFPITAFRTKGIGASKARNAGAEQAKGSYFIFCDAHLFFEDHWIEKLIDPIEKGIADAVSPGIAPHDKPNTVGYGYRLDLDKFKAVFNGKSVLPKDLRPFETAGLPGGCLAITKRVFDDIGGFDKGFLSWGHEDFEISLKLWLFGYKCYIQPKVKILHVFRKAFPYQVSVVKTDYNMMRMAYSHFSEERIEKCKKYIRVPEKTEGIIERVIKYGGLEQREQYFSRRKYDDDWYFKRFHIDF
mgnify:CR=1 FL=1